MVPAVTCDPLDENSSGHARPLWCDRRICRDGCILTVIPLVMLCGMFVRWLRQWAMKSEMKPWTKWWIFRGFNLCITWPLFMGPWHGQVVQSGMRRWSTMLSSPKWFESHRVMTTSTRWTGTNLGWRSVRLTGALMPNSIQELDAILTRHGSRWFEVSALYWWSKNEEYIANGLKHRLERNCRRLVKTNNGSKCDVIPARAKQAWWGGIGFIDCQVL